jgi:hypothetical protein
MTIWRCCKKDPPPMAWKVLCMNRGDFFVAQRFEDFYFPIPFIDSKYAKNNLFPELWCEIDFMEPYTEYMKFIIDGKKMLADEFKIKDPDEYKDLLDSLIKSVKDAT